MNRRTALHGILGGLLAPLLPALPLLPAPRTICFDIETCRTGTGSLFDKQSPQIAALIERNMKVFLPARDPLWN